MSELTRHQIVRSKEAKNSKIGSYVIFSSVQDKIITYATNIDEDGKQSSFIDKDGKHSSFCFMLMSTGEDAARRNHLPTWEGHYNFFFKEKKNISVCYYTILFKVL